MTLFAVCDHKGGIFTLESFFPHFLAYLVAIGSTALSFFVLGLLIRRLPRWRKIGNGLLLAGPLTLVLMVVAQLTFDPTAAGANIGIAGLTERVAVTEVFACFVALGLTALRTHDAREFLALGSPRSQRRGGTPAIGRNSGRVPGSSYPVGTRRPAAYVIYRR